MIVIDGDTNKRDLAPNPATPGFSIKAFLKAGSEEVRYALVADGMADQEAEAIASSKFFGGARCKIVDRPWKPVDRSD